MCNLWFLATFQFVCWRAYAWMVAYVRANGGEHTRECTPTNAYNIG
ncbi:MAG: hypothetical protein Q4F45_08925 [Alistipes sp.]|nr:hypothetical protein [Alistipes sp.]